MKGLNREFCERIASARREAGISQTALAAEIGCKQSALSPFERGDGTKLSDEAIKRLSEKFGIPLPAGSAAVGRTVFPLRGESFAAGSGFCPNPDCPSHQRLEIGGRVIFHPDRKQTDPVGARFCAICGEVLERNCPNCGLPVHDGAVCSFCGNTYVSV